MNIIIFIVFVVLFCQDGFMVPIGYLSDDEGMFHDGDGERKLGFDEEAEASELKNKSSPGNLLFMIVFLILLLFVLMGIRVERRSSKDQLWNIQLWYLNLLMKNFACELCKNMSIPFLSPLSPSLSLICILQLGSIDEMYVSFLSSFLVE